MSPAKRKVVVAAGALTVLAGWAVAACAAEAPPVRIKVLGIRATNEESPHVDAELEPLKNSLARSGYNSFRVVAKQQRDVPGGATAEFPLVEGYALRVEPGETDAKNVTLTLVWIRYEQDAQGRRVARVLQRMPMTIRKGKFFVSGGWQLKEGVLIAAMSAE